MIFIPLIIVSGLFLMACILILYVLLKKKDSKDPLSILKERLARGEISEEEFDELKRNFY